MTTESQKHLVKQFFDDTSKSYDKVVGLTTFGRDSYWKDQIIKKIPSCNSILDIACGTGILTFKIAEEFPHATITGVDMTEGYLNKAKNKLKPHQKISFLLEDAEKLNLDAKFDCITSSYIAKYCIPDVLIKRCISHLNPGGIIILHDFTNPGNIVIRLLWNLYFIVLNMVGFFVPQWKDVFKNLPQLIKSANWVGKYKDTMEREGLRVKVQYLTLDSSAILTGLKKV